MDSQAAGLRKVGAKRRPGVQGAGAPWLDAKRLFILCTYTTGESLSEPPTLFNVGMFNAHTILFFEEAIPIIDGQVKSIRVLILIISLMCSIEFSGSREVYLTFTSNREYVKSTRCVDENNVIHTIATKLNGTVFGATAAVIMNLASEPTRAHCYLNKMARDREKIMAMMSKDEYYKYHMQMLKKHQDDIETFDTTKRVHLVEPATGNVMNAFAIRKQEVFEEELILKTERISVGGV